MLNRQCYSEKPAVQRTGMDKFLASQSMEKLVSLWIYIHNVLLKRN
jgi:hypothetical protein